MPANGRRDLIRCLKDKLPRFTAMQRHNSVGRQVTDGGQRILS